MIGYPMEPNSSRMVILAPRSRCFIESGILKKSLDALCIQKRAAISKFGTIGIFFFEDDRDNADTVTKELYIPVLEQFWGEMEERVDLDEEETLLQQNGAPPHTNVTMADSPWKVWVASHQLQSWCIMGTSFVWPETPRHIPLEVPRRQHLPR